MLYMPHQCHLTATAQLFSFCIRGWVASHTNQTMVSCICPYRSFGGMFKSERLFFGITTTLILELDRYIGNTHHQGRLSDNRNHQQMMTIGDQSVPMFHDDLLTEFT